MKIVEHDNEHATNHRLDGLVQIFPFISQDEPHVFPEDHRYEGDEYGCVEVVRTGRYAGTIGINYDCEWLLQGVSPEKAEEFAGAILKAVEIARAVKSPDAAGE